MQGENDFKAEYKGISVNKVEAAKYYKIAADLYDEKSSHKCAQMLDTGEGISINK